MPVEFSSNAQGMIRYINNRLSQLDRQSQQILADRVSLLRQLNDSQSSDSILPDEILSSIFVMAHQVFDKSISPIILGAVCFRWRRIVWGIPTLWSTIGPIPHRSVLGLLDVEILKLYFQNAAQHPIQLSLRLDDLIATHKVIENFFSVILEENPLKIQTLILSFAYSSTIPTKIKRAIDRSKLPNLSTISFEATQASKKGPAMMLNPLSLPFHSSNNIRTLMVNSCRLRSVEQLSQTRFTVFKFRHIPIDQCLNVLLLCPKMVEFHCHSPSPALRQNELRLRYRKILRDLEVFDVDLDGNICMSWTSQATYASYLSFLLTHFEFPNLKYFGWGTLQKDTRHAFEMFLSAMKFLITFKFKSCHRDCDVLSLFKYLSPTVRTVYLPGGMHTPKVALDSVKYVTSRIDHGSQGMTTLEVASSDDYDTTSFTLDLYTIMDDFRKVGIVI